MVIKELEDCIFPNSLSLETELIPQICIVLLQKIEDINIICQVTKSRISSFRKKHYFSFLYEIKKNIEYLRPSALFTQALLACNRDDQIFYIYRD